MTIPANLQRRVEDLEATIARLTDAVNMLSGRLQTVTQQRWIYLAKTIRVGGSYPTSGNTFGLRFIDREFTPEEGTQSATDHARSASYQQIGRTFAGEYLLEGTPVLAVRAPRPPGTSGKGEWHIVPVGSAIVRGITLGENLKGGHGSVTRYVDGSDAPSGDTDDVFNDFIDVGTGKVVMYVKIGAKWYLLAVECPPEG